MKTISFIILCSIAFSYNASSQWSLCEGPYGGSFSAIYADTVTGRLYAGSIGNINYSSDNGNTWHEGSGKAGYDEVKQFVKLNQTMYASGTAGVFKSDDGIVWSSCNLNLTDTYIMYMAVLNGKLYISTWSGLYRLSDNGLNWDLISGGLPEGTYVSSIVSQDSIFLASTENRKMYKSTDFGATWQQFYSNIDIGSTAALIADDSVILASTWNGFYISYDHGINFYWANVPKYIINWTTSRNVIYGITDNELYYSADHGYTWSVSDLSYLAFPHSLAVMGNKLFLGTGYGVNLSEDNGQNWVTKNIGLLKMYFTALGSIGDDLLVPTMSGQLFKSKDQVLGWTDMTKNYSEDIIHAFLTDGNDIYAAANELYYSNDSAEHWQKRTAMNQEVLDLLKTGDTLFMATLLGMYRSCSDGPAEAVNDGLPLEFPFAMSVVKMGSDLYAGLYVKGIYKSNVNNISWQLLNNGLPEDEALNCMFVNDTVIYACFAYTGIYRSFDKGSTWINCNNNLGDSISVSSIISDGKNLFIGTNIGAYLSNDNGNSWSSISEGLPDNTFVMDIIINDNKLYLTCPTRGIWKREMSDFNPETGVSPIKSTTIVVYPTMVTDLVHISIPGNSAHNITELYDLAGVKIQTYNNIHTINLGNLYRGVYILKVRAGGTVFTQKITKL